MLKLLETRCRDKLDFLLSQGGMSAGAIIASDNYILGRFLPEDGSEGNRSIIFRYITPRALAMRIRNHFIEDVRSGQLPRWVWKKELITRTSGGSGYGNVYYNSRSPGMNGDTDFSDAVLECVDQVFKNGLTDVERYYLCLNLLSHEGMINDDWKCICPFHNGQQNGSVLNEV